METVLQYLPKALEALYPSQRIKDAMIATTCLRKPFT